MPANEAATRALAMAKEVLAQPEQLAVCLREEEASFADDVVTLSGLGFEAPWCALALEQENQNKDRAAAWLLSYAT